MFSQKDNFSKEMELQGHNIDTREEHASSSLIASGSGLLGVLLEYALLEAPMGRCDMVESFISMESYPGFPKSHFP